jgi:putative PIN family toxin of toxin-antitoxin system
MRLVLDTNVVVAGLLWTGPPRRLLDRTIDSAHTLYSSPALVDELAHTLRYQKFVQRIGLSGSSALGLVAQYSALVTLLSPIQVPRVIEHDTDDDQVIAAAVAAQADLIVSGDRKHLLPLGSHEGIAIVDVAQALRLIGE